MVQPLNTLTETASQTAGPYVHIGCTPNFVGIEGIYDEDLGLVPFPKDEPGEHITITGTILDGTGTVLRDVLVESWQCNAEGTFGPGSRGFARMPSDLTTGIWTLNTVKPAAVGKQSPHIALWIVARGINIGLQTRIYFEGDDHSADPLLTRLEHQNRVETLIAKKTGDNSYQFDIRLQGEGETVFLDL
ncbi:protocatechuate 3,4-dioxygenase subunit alpha [Phaeobacter sp. 22II1-1F12B]|uniref:protocatechuate 3,4-dioxygenase subunit alpha n=1 Tax=Phaeobacter sp. 22II1-1F12B TaxID=1317111 RepID=UPI000B5281F0|nr:protocatechuate 3,4-dioxygenase subunit alpha [Phaeobacter sp. 22II1-1F12B]OWU81954.1 protocatechuate 3,4-dioxygenase [Phaeobacter sp. 22II1-1F12B]